MLALNNVVKSFGGLRAVNRVSTHIAQGEIIGLIGPNGAGKTTLFNLITGTYLPDAGSIQFENVDVTQLLPNQRCQLGIARTFQLVRIFPDLTAIENVCVGMAYGRQTHSQGMLQQLLGGDNKRLKAQAHDILATVGLPDKGEIEAKHLTLVNRKRVELARALASNPKLLLLDEFLAGLNPSEVVAAIELIRNIRKSGVTILMVEHIVSAIFGLADRVLCMAAGEKIAEGLPSEIAANQAVIDVYLGEEHSDHA